MRFGYHDDIFRTCPELNAGVVWVRGFAGAMSDTNLDSQIDETLALVHERFPSTAEISQWPSIAAWREVYSRFGAKPNRYQCAAENLIRQIVKSDRFPSLHPVVDLCNVAAASYAIPVAPFDAGAMVGDCIVRPATSGERFRAINSDEVQEIPAGEVIYADASADVISRRWNWRQADKGKITPETRNFLVTAEAAHIGGRETVEGVLTMLVEALEGHAAATDLCLLDTDRRSVTLPS